MSNLGFAIAIDVTGLGFGVTAVGGFFGDSNGNADGPTSRTDFTVTLAGGGSPTIFADQQVLEFAAGEPHSFFGFTATEGDVIERIEFEMAGNFETLDDMQFGVAGATSVPTPASLSLLAAGPVLFGFARRRAS